jgi:hypothetical protein
LSDNLEYTRGQGNRFLSATIDSTGRKGIRFWVTTSNLLEDNGAVYECCDRLYLRTGRPFVERQLLSFLMTVRSFTEATLNSSVGLGGWFLCATLDSSGRVGKIFIVAPLKLLDNREISLCSRRV